MNKEMLELAKKSSEEGWDAYRIMSVFSDLQKQKDALVAEAAGSPEIAELIRISRLCCSGTILH